jgi:hypothetical protein
MVFLGLMIAHFIAPSQFPWPIILTLSAIASATAPGRDGLGDPPI